jgi:pyruvate formate lyase activating enzyme
LRIKGFQGTSLLDFPGRVASLVFTGGCNLSCGFCHNPGLVLDPDQYPDYPLDELLEDLKQRSSFIDGVVVSGGEPTLATGLTEFLEQVKGLGLQVKLDSNGLLPRVLSTLFERELVDYLAIDFKTSPARYAELHRSPVDVAAFLASCRLAIERAPEYEFRTTCVPGLVAEDELRAMGEVIKGAGRWVLQQFVPRDEMLGDAPRQAYPATEFARLRQIAEPYVGQLEGRGW